MSVHTSQPTDIISHRGLTTVAPENTIPACTAALQQGFGMEIDIRNTADGKFVVTHDSNLERMTGVNEEVHDLTLNDVKDLRIRTEEHDGVYEIPTLEEILELFIEEVHSSARLALHLKGTDWDKRTSALIDVLSRWNDRSDIDIFDRVFVFDVTVDTAKEIKTTKSVVSVGLSVGDPDYFPIEQYPTIYRYEDVGDLDCWDVVWADEWRGSLYSTEFVRRVRTDDRTIICVSPELHTTIDPPHPECDNPANTWDRILDYDVNGICTDFPTELSMMNP